MCLLVFFLVAGVYAIEETLKPMSQAEEHITVKLGFLTQQVSEYEYMGLASLAQKSNDWGMGVLLLSCIFQVVSCTFCLSVILLSVPLYFLFLPVIRSRRTSPWTRGGWIC